MARVDHIPPEQEHKLRQRCSRAPYLLCSPASFNLIHVKLLNSNLTPHTSTHCLLRIPMTDSDTEVGHKLLVLCKHTRRPPSSSKTSHLPFHQPHIHPNEFQVW